MTEHHTRSIVVSADQPLAYPALFGVVPLGHKVVSLYLCMCVLWLSPKGHLDFGKKGDLLNSLWAVVCCVHQFYMRYSSLRSTLPPQYANTALLSPPRKSHTL